jgi:cytochrome c2
MKMKGSFILALALVLAATLCSLSLPEEPEKAKNLKVLPKNISHEELDNVMRGFKNALGVKCSFCHEPRKDDPKKLDFASDGNKHKEVARDMMRMTARINKKYFKGHETLSVTCYTCHRGNEEPKTLPDTTQDAKK